MKNKKMGPMATVAALATGAVGLGIAGGSGVGIESVLPDGSTDVNTWPTLLGALTLLVGALGQGSTVLHRALLSAPVDASGNTSAEYTMSIAINQAYQERKPDLVKDLCDTLAKRAAAGLVDTAKQEKKNTDDK